MPGMKAGYGSYRDSIWVWEVQWLPAKVHQGSTLLIPDLTKPEMADLMKPYPHDEKLTAYWVLDGGTTIRRLCHQDKSESFNQVLVHQVNHLPTRTPLNLF